MLVFTCGFIADKFTGYDGAKVDKITVEFIFCPGRWDIGDEYVSMLVFVTIWTSWSNLQRKQVNCESRCSNLIWCHCTLIRLVPSVVDWRKIPLYSPHV